MLIYCEQCGKKTTHSRKQVENSNHSFCCKKCYYEYKKSHPSEFATGKNTGRSKELKKLEMMALVRKGELSPECLNKF